MMELDFFRIHHEKKLGFKRITPTELGANPKSNQTHIGLYDDILTFLPNQAEIDNAIFIHRDRFEFLGVYFDRIENQNGTYRSPKIRVGSQHSISVVSVIRDIASSENRDCDWFLVWFGLENEQIVFLLCRQDDEVFTNLKRIGLHFTNKGGRLSEENHEFRAIIEYVIGIVNRNGESAIIDTVADTLHNFSKSSREQPRIKGFDLVKAEEVLALIGRQGEIFVDHYLSLQQSHNYISNYIWQNRDKESGQPYDFRIESCEGNSIYLDVKSTRSEFDRKILFSNNEIEFAADWIPRYHHRYQIYRIFNMEEKTADLRICHNPNRVLLDIHSMVSKIFIENHFAYKGVSIEGVKIGLLPTIQELVFDRVKAIKLD
ncbi:DUF3883 domain-containing protein [uncultured Sphaerochaeta sp.]|uniref:DUF3883 domain-containing protein n=1 Tax=uncultured Sphaerochaeta sp. TaxID=886478 RepID=UPI0029C9DE3C|nr:DUF3883 domain-containing protein [uncultured Sphaerochaeta sp.]